MEKQRFGKDKDQKIRKSPPVTDKGDLPSIVENHPITLTPNDDAYIESYTGTGTVPPFTKVKIRRLVTPDSFNQHADRVLFMLSLAEHRGVVHTLARAIGSAGGDEYNSRIMHGRMLDEGRFIFDTSPVLDTKCREDPRIVKIGDIYYFTNTLIPQKGVAVTGLSSTTDFKKYENHGAIIHDFGKLHAKDATFFPDTSNGLLMLTRFKPGIQLVKFDSMQDVFELGKDPRRCVEFWRTFLKRYGDSPAQYDYLSPQMPEMRSFEDRWKPVLDELIYGRILPQHPNYEHFQLLDDEERDKVWYGSGPAPIRTSAGWLDFPHRGQTIAEYSEADKRYLERVGRGAEPIRFYCLLATIRDLEDPRKLIAVSPMPISFPDPDNDMEMNVAQERHAIPFVKIATGSLRVIRGGKPHILVPVGVNDKYTRLEYFPEEEFLNWMLTHGRVKS